MAEKGTFENPVEAVYVQDISVIDPDSGRPVTLELWKDPESGGMFAIDESFVDQVEEVIVSPFNTKHFLHLSETAIERRVDFHRPPAGESQ